MINAIDKSRSGIILDIECFKNYFLISFKTVRKKEVLSIELRGASRCLNTEQRRLVANLLQKITIGFNSLNYDLSMILLAIKGHNVGQLKTFSDEIICGKKLGWQFARDHDLDIKSPYHIDLIQVAAGVMIGLKLYGARLHVQKIQDLPYPPDSLLTDKQMDHVRDYCAIDLDDTEQLYKRVLPDLKLRAAFAKKYGHAFLSKSDAQIAESYLRHSLKDLTGKWPVRGNVETAFRYKAPIYIQFKDSKLAALLTQLSEHVFHVDDKGRVELPAFLKHPIELKGRIYQCGIGGLHSQETAQTIKPSEDECLIDADVSSYYPMLILNQKLYPESIGEDFLSLYGQMVADRLEAKRVGDTHRAKTLKICINGSFGKFGSPYSFLYSPKLLIQTTLTGQLCLLMLIEQLLDEGIQVVSANTDGVTALIPPGKYPEYAAVCGAWEEDTKLTLDYTEYSATYHRDVNNYLAVTTSGELKRKGIFTPTSLTKNPQGEIIYRAVEGYLVNGTPVADFIKTWANRRLFIHARSVKGGAVFEGAYLGKVVRWIWSKTGGGDIVYLSNGNRVAQANGCVPVMDLDDMVGVDIDYDRYIKSAEDVLEQLGLTHDA